MNPEDMAAAAAGGASSEAPKDDAVDAEFEEVKDDEDKK